MAFWRALAGDFCPPAVIVGTRFKYPNGVELVIDIAAPDDIDERLEAYAISPGIEQGLHAIYAQATYLKYQTANENFGVVATSPADLEGRMKQALPHIETLVLIEATRTDTNQIVGAALLRFGWNGNLVFDFVGSNPSTRGEGVQKLENIGSCLIYEGLRLAKSFGAEDAFAETAYHSVKWWHNHLAKGSDLIKADTVKDALTRTRDLLTKLIITEF